jgi:uncharacterized membrane protein YkvA (DUF1232 family)
MAPLLVVAAVLGGAWLAFALILWLHRPTRETAAVTIRLVPDIGRLCYRLMRDPQTPRRHKVALAGLAAYLASPIDPIPDFLPGIGSLDDLIVAGLVLGWVARGTAQGRLEQLWPGSPESLALLRRVLHG